jgi:hypothetical protein
MSQKELALDALSRLPDDCTSMEIFERLRLLLGIQEGIDQLDRGEGIAHEDVKKDSASWLST